MYGMKEIQSNLYRVAEVELRLGPWPEVERLHGVGGHDGLVDVDLAMAAPVDLLLAVVHRGLHVEDVLPVAAASSEIAIDIRNMTIRTLTDDFRKRKVCS